MADETGYGSITEVTSRNWLSRLLGSVVGALIGIVMVIGSIVLLAWNEGRAVEAIRALDAAARHVVEIGAAAVEPGGEGKLVHLSGMMETKAPARDPAFGVGGAGVLRLARRVEMFQWKEEKTTRTERSVGGSEKTITTYSYKKTWSAQPIDSSEFREQQHHRNPPMPLRSTVIEAGDVRLGAYRVDPALLKEVSAFEPLPPATVPAGYQNVGDALYRSQDPGNPAVGDIRVSFRAVPAQRMSIVAALHSGVLGPYHDKTGYRIALAGSGTVPTAEMFRQKKHSEQILTWVLRGLGFLVMFVGFLLIGGPLSALAGVLPFLEDVVWAGVGLVALALAVPLTLITIALAWIAYRPLVGGVPLVAGAAFACCCGTSIAPEGARRLPPPPSRSRCASRGSIMSRATGGAGIARRPTHSARYLRRDSRL